MYTLLFAFAGYTLVFGLLWHNRPSRDRARGPSRENRPPKADPPQAGGGQTEP